MRVFFLPSDSGNTSLGSLDSAFLNETRITNAKIWSRTNAIWTSTSASSYASASSQISWVKIVANFTSACIRSGALSIKTRSIASSHAPSGLGVHTVTRVTLALIKTNATTVRTFILTFRHASSVVVPHEAWPAGANSWGCAFSVCATPRTTRKTGFGLTRRIHVAD